MNSLHILVCDDEQNICQLLMDLFAQFGHQAVTCQSGEEAISLVQEQTFDLAFIDLRMPGIGGDEVLKRARIIHPETRFILMTGYARDDILQEALRDGAAACLSKPFSLSQVIRLVEQVTSGQSVEV